MAKDEEQCHHIVHLNKIKLDFDINFIRKLCLEDLNKLAYRWEVAGLL